MSNDIVKQFYIALAAVFTAAAAEMEDAETTPKKRKAAAAPEEDDAVEARPKKRKPAAAEPEPEADEEAAELDFEEDVKPVVAKALKKLGGAKLRKVFAEYGAAKLGEVEASDYAALVEALNEMMEG